MERINDVVVVLVVVQFYVNNLCYILPPWLTINEIRWRTSDVNTCGYNKIPAHIRYLRKNPDKTSLKAVAPKNRQDKKSRLGLYKIRDLKSYLRVLLGILQQFLPKVSRVSRREESISLFRYHQRTAGGLAGQAVRKNLSCQLTCRSGNKEFSILQWHLWKLEGQKEFTKILRCGQLSWALRLQKRQQGIVLGVLVSLQGKPWQYYLWWW